MRDKQRTVLSWVVVVLVFLLTAFLLRALLLNGTLPESNSPQPTVGVSVTVTPQWTPTPEAATQVPDTPEKGMLPESPYPSAPDSATATPATVDDASQPGEATPGPAGMPFRLQLGSPRYLPAFTHPDQGCSWLGVAGQVFDADGSSRTQTVVFASGDLEGKPVNYVAVTGNYDAYGPGGYEIFLSDHLPSVSSALKVQLFNIDGDALSDPVLVNIPGDCSQNLMLVNFEANIAEMRFYIPVVAGQ